jgi:hypothetical protein
MIIESYPPVHACVYTKMTFPITMRKFWGSSFHESFLLTLVVSIHPVHAIINPVILPQLIPFFSNGCKTLFCTFYTSGNWKNAPIAVIKNLWRLFIWSIFVFFIARYLIFSSPISVRQKVCNLAWSVVDVLRNAKSFQVHFHSIILTFQIVTVRQTCSVTGEPLLLERILYPKALSHLLQNHLWLFI